MVLVAGLLLASIAGLSLLSAGSEEPSEKPEPTAENDDAAELSEAVLPTAVEAEMVVGEPEVTRDELRRGDAREALDEALALGPERGVTGRLIVAGIDGPQSLAIVDFDRGVVEDLAFPGLDRQWWAGPEGLLCCRMTVGDGTTNVRWMWREWDALDRRDVRWVDLQSHEQIGGLFSDPDAGAIALITRGFDPGGAPEPGTVTIIRLQTGERREVALAPGTRIVAGPAVGDARLAFAPRESGAGVGDVATPLQWTWGSGFLGQEDPDASGSDEESSDTAGSMGVPADPGDLDWVLSPDGSRRAALSTAPATASLPPTEPDGESSSLLRLTLVVVDAANGAPVVTRDAVVFAAPESPPVWMGETHLIVPGAPGADPRIVDLLRSDELTLELGGSDPTASSPVTIVGWLRSPGPDR